jgi:hypothetical protein
MTKKEIDKLHKTKPTTDIMFRLAAILKLTGTFTIWYDTGKKRIECYYKDGVLIN